MTIRRWSCGAIAALACTWAAAHAAAPIAPDALDETLALVGLQRADLGWVPKGWWPRWPADIPYKLRAFDALFAEPLDTIPYTRALGQTAWEKLDPANLQQENGRRARPLFEAVQRLGIDPKFGGFRGYTANVLAPEMPLDAAILKLYEAAHRTTTPSTFGMDLPYPRIAEQLAQQVQVLPEGVSPILGQLVLNLVEAHYWVELAFRNVDAHDRLVAATRTNTGEEMIDAYDYCPEFDDVARTWDEPSMWYAAQKCVDALDLARVKLQAWKAAGGRALPDYEGPSKVDEACNVFSCDSPWGRIIVRGDARDLQLVPSQMSDVLRLVDLGADAAVYVGALCASDVATPITMLLDLGGDDHYDAGGAHGQGCGATGVGIVLDVAGDDTYQATNHAQGVGQFGFGLLADLEGNDTYELKYSGQGCGYFGVGLLFDVAGHDRYDIYCDGQGLGGVAGVGVLADRTGNDRYIAQRKHSVTGRPSYHSPDLDVGVSNVQGCGMGRRGDGADGHSWAGGLGALLDGEGNDYYSAGNWCMGTGYWYGIGVLHDRGGDDEYHGAVYSQGTGAHFCIGVCLDEGGNDKHLAEENSHSCLAWAHDFTIGVLLDVAGDDLYRVDGAGMSYSINRSVSLLMDLAGNDTYQTDVARRQKEKAGLRPGYALNPEGFRARGVAEYFAETTSLGLFLDIGGDDTYWTALTTQPETAPAEPPIGNDRTWLDPPAAPNWADRNFSVGVDRPAGAVDFAPRPVKPPSAGPRAED